MNKTWTKVYKQSYPWYTTGGVHEGDEGKSWWRQDVYLHADGMVVITLFDHELANKKIQTTEFQTIIEGYRYRMVIDSNDFTQRSLQTQAAYFLSEALQRAKEKSETTKTEEA